MPRESPCSTEETLSENQADYVDPPPNAYRCSSQRFISHVLRHGYVAEDGEKKYRQCSRCDAIFPPSGYLRREQIQKG